MIELNYRFKILKIWDDTWDYEPAVRIDYVVRWYHGNFPWEYTDKTYGYYIPTCEASEPDSINLFANLKARDIPDNLVYNLIYLDIEHEHLQDGVEIVTHKKRHSLNKWSVKIVKRMDYDEKTGLTNERKSAIMELEKEWFGEDK